MAGYHLRDFTFAPTDDGGLEIMVRTRDSHGANIVRAIHLDEDELYEMLAACGLSADEIEEDDLEDFEALPEEEEEEF